MLVDAELGAEFWAEAALTACLLRNISPVKKRTATPFELFTGRKPNLSFLRIWSSIGLYQAREAAGQCYGSKIYSWHIC